MTNSELQSLELQARIMGWAPAIEWDCIVDVPGPRLVRVPLRSTGEYPTHDYVDGLDRSEY